MNFNKIDNLILFGGSPLLAALACQLQAIQVRLTVFSAPRHLEEHVGPQGATLADVLKQAKVDCHSVADINLDPTLAGALNENSLGLGLGAAWGFGKELVQRFDGRLLDFHPVRMPQYRGGAHHSWQIMRLNQLGASVLELINEETVPDHSGSGLFVKYHEYLLPPDIRVPKDYLDAVVREGVPFLVEFVTDAIEGKYFPLTTLQENFSLYFPRLETMRHGFVDWTWSTKEIEAFICAFDNPYPGASTFVEGKRVFLKKCRADYVDGSFHSFQAGLIYRRANDAIYVASKDGAIVVQEMTDETGADVIGKMDLGQRLFTPRAHLEDAMLYRAEYGAMGSIEEN